ncbi:RICIN domain-containing protein [Ferruginibacter profundus]
MNRIALLVAFFSWCIVSHAQTLSDGEYLIKINATGKYVAVAGASTNNGAWIIQWDNEYKAHFKFILKNLGNNIYSIKASHSGKYLSTEGNAVRGAKIIQWDWLNQDNQKWRIENSSTGWHITCVQNEQRMYLSGLNAATAAAANGAYFICNSDDAAMNFTFRKNETGQQLINTKPGNKMTSVNNDITAVAKQITADVPDGIYKIRINESGKYLAIAGEEDMNNGMRLIQWDMLPRNNHLFALKRMDNGNYTITAVHSNKLLDVVDRQAADGTQVQQWDDLQGSNQQWKIYGTANSYKIVSAASEKGLQLSAGISNNNNGTALIITGNSMQTFSLLPARANKFTEYITLKNLRLTVPHGGDLDMFGVIQVQVVNKNGISLNKYYLTANVLLSAPESMAIDMDKKRVFDVLNTDVKLAIPAEEIAGAQVKIIYGINESDADVNNPFKSFGVAAFKPGGNPEAPASFSTAPFVAGGADDYYLLKNVLSTCVKSKVDAGRYTNTQSFYVSDIPNECMVHVNLQDEDGSDNWLDIFFTITKERK